jgi:hypothetical protein
MVNRKIIVNNEPVWEYHNFSPLSLLISGSAQLYGG